MDHRIHGSFEDRTNSTNIGLARAMGLFSLGLGVVAVASPRTVARAIGIDDADNEAVIRGVGMQELSAAAGLLWGSKPAPFLWSRVAGDAMHLAMLAKARASRDDGSRRARISAAMLGVAAVAIPDVIGSVRTGDGVPSLRRTSDDGSADVSATVTIRRSADDLYAAWRDVASFPRFMTHVDTVEDIGGGRTRWRATGPAGVSVEWNAETTEDTPGRRMSWRSVEGSDVDNAGSVEFTPAARDRGTEVQLRLSYAPPGGTAGRVVAKLLGEEPKQQVSDDLRRFKQLMEGGDVTRSEAVPDGLRSTRVLRQRPGQPLAA